MSIIREILTWFMFVIVFYDSVMIYENNVSMKRLAEYNRNSTAIIRLVSDMKDAECGQRGFIYTNGDENYIGQYYVGLHGVGVQLTLLRAYLATAPESHPTMDKLIRDIDLKLTELATTIKYFRQGDPEKTREIVVSNAGLHYMQEIEADAVALRGEEADRLHYRGLLQ